MNKNSKFRELVKYRAGALCLIGILTATFMHSTTFMSQFFYGSIVLGAVAAFAIDAGVVAMSIFKDELIKDGELAWMVRVVTALVLIASGVANMAEGFVSAYGIQLTYANLIKQDWLIITQWLTGTVIFPVLAYVMCDTIGTRNLVELRQNARQPEIKPQSVVVAANPLIAAQGKGRKTIANNKAARMAAVRNYKTAYPDASLQEVADAVGVAKETVRNYLNEMSKNGHQKQQADDDITYSNLNNSL